MAEHGTHEYPEYSDENKIIEKINSLQKDVPLCLKTDVVFPTLLYCFAIIDFLGAVAAGNATSFAPTTAQAASYMKRFMGYNEEQVRLLQGQFRHKLVHLGEPKSIIKDAERLISWRYWYDKADVHLKLVPFGSVEWHMPWALAVSFGVMFPVDYEFNVSITHFTSDIATSALGQGGLIAQMQRDVSLRRNVRTALHQILNDGLV